MPSPFGFLIFFFHDFVHLAPGKRFLFIDLAIIKRHQGSRGDLYHQQCNARARKEGSGSISRGLLFLPIRDTHCLFPFGMTRASEAKAIRREERIATNEERGIDRTGRLFYRSGITCFGAWISFWHFLLFLCLLFLLLLIGIKRVRITKSDSHLERNSFTTR